MQEHKDCHVLTEGDRSQRDTDTTEGDGGEEESADYAQVSGSVRLYLESVCRKVLGQLPLDPYSGRIA